MYTLSSLDRFREHLEEAARRLGLFHEDDGDED
jgi:hypothetical protein